MTKRGSGRRGIGRRALLSAVLGLPVGLVGGLPGTPVAAQPATGTVAGRVFDRRTGASLGGANVTVGNDTHQRATVAHGAGRYAFTGIAPARNLDVIAFLPGYTYLLLNRDLVAGGSVTADFGIIPEPNPELVPTIHEPRISTVSAEPGQEVVFTMRVRPGSEVPLSPEVIVMNPALGRLVLLTPAGGDLWGGTWQVPDDLADGVYPWTFFAVDEACREPVVFPTLDLQVTARRFFPETGKTVPGAFLHYWTTRGGLAIYGYPISEAVEEVNPADGQTYQVQYFERNRFEYHPENGGTEFEVLLGLLGRQVTVGREDEPPFQGIPSFADTPERRYFEATGHSLGSSSGFRIGTALVVWPSSAIHLEFQEATKDGQTIRSRLRRARFEYQSSRRPARCCSVCSASKSTALKWKVATWRPDWCLGWRCWSGWGVLTALTPCPPLPPSRRGGTRPDHRSNSRRHRVRIRQVQASRRRRPWLGGTHRRRPRPPAPRSMRRPPTVGMRRRLAGGWWRSWPGAIAVIPAVVRAMVRRCGEVASHRRRPASALAFAPATRARWRALPASPTSAWTAHYCLRHGPGRGLPGSSGVGAKSPNSEGTLKVPPLLWKRRAGTRYAHLGVKP
jgi:hypothetical protein